MVFKFHDYRIMQPFEEQYSRLPPSQMMRDSAGDPHNVTSSIHSCLAPSESSPSSPAAPLLPEATSPCPNSLVDILSQSFRPFSCTLSSAWRVFPHPLPTPTWKTPQLSESIKKKVSSLHTLTLLVPRQKWLPLTHTLPGWGASLQGVPSPTAYLPKCLQQQWAPRLSPTTQHCTIESKPLWWGLGLFW